MPAALQLAGQQFGRLSVIGFAGDYRGQTLWECRCDCGNLKIVRGAKLAAGLTRSCGCLRREAPGVAPRHGHSRQHARSPEYVSWRAMLTRCNDKDDNGYKRYGAKGITVCDAWTTSFETFLNDMGPCPGPGYTVDRKDGALGYSKDNCRWATKREQALNRKNTILVEIAGAPVPLRLAAEALGIPEPTIARRMYTMKMSPEQALFYRRSGSFSDAERSAAILSILKHIEAA